MKKLYILTMLFLALTFSASLVVAQNQTIHNPNIKPTVTKEQIKVYAENSPKSPDGVIDLSFEGCPEMAAIGDYYNGGTGGNYGITFSSNSLALISVEGGGSGNFCNNSSPYACC